GYKPGVLMMTTIKISTCTSSFTTPPPTTKHYTLSLHDALPISRQSRHRLHRYRIHRTRNRHRVCPQGFPRYRHSRRSGTWETLRSEEHTSELQSRENLVCRLLLDKKK